MKKIILILLIVIWIQDVSAQNYSIEFGNDPNYHINLSLSSYKINVKGISGTELKIDRKVLDPETCCKELENTDYAKQMKDFEKQNAEMEKHMSELQQRMSNNSNDAREDRSAGLKSLNDLQKENTGIGLVIEKSGNTISISNAHNLSGYNEFTLYLPDKATISFNDIIPQMRSDINFEDYKGEIVINTINSNLKFKNVSGPIVANATNGNIEVAYKNLAPEKPNAISAVNGFVDITLNSKTKANLKLNAINGEAFTDFDINVKSTTPMNAMPASMDMVNIEGEINGGGQLITVSSVMGDIYLRKEK